MVGRAAMLVLGLLASVGAIAAESAAGDLKDLERRLERVEAIKAIERLQSIYGYYQDRFLFDQPPTLFTRKQPAAYFDNGVWEGTAGVERLWLGYFRKTLARNTKGPLAGELFDQPQMQGVVTVAEDGQTASATFRTLGRRVKYGQHEEWIVGLYNNDYVKEDGVWKFKTLRYCTLWAAPYTKGWKDVEPVKPVRWQLYPRNAEGPNRLATDAERCPSGYPKAVTGDFSFKHPVTGESLREIASRVRS
jgi:hypothetical protein